MNVNRQQGSARQQMANPVGKRKCGADAGILPKGASGSSMPIAVEALAQGVQKLVVGSTLPEQTSHIENAAASANLEAQRVLRLDSFNGSSDKSLGMGQSSPINIQERLRQVKAMAGIPLDRRQGIRSPGASNDINRAKKSRKGINPEVLAKTFREVQQDGKMTTAMMIQMGATTRDTNGDVCMQEQETREVPSTGCSSTVDVVNQGGNMVLDVNLTGSQGETRQEK